jgi:histone acetyltransferase
MLELLAHGDVVTVEAGWTEKTSQKATLRGEGGLQGQLEKLMKAVKGHPSAWPFEQPVDTNEVADYLDVITDPIGKKQPPRESCVWIRN